MAKTRIADIRIGKRYRKSMGHLSSLKDSIEAIGLLHPIVIDETGKLVVGRRRLEACRQLGMEQIEARTVNLGNILRAEHEENECRLDFAPSEKVAIGEALRSREEEAAKKRQRDAGKERGKGQIASGKLPEAIDTRDAVGRKVGMSGKTYERAREVVEAAKAEPDKYQPLVDEMDRTGRVSGVHKKLETQQTTDGEPPPLAQGLSRALDTVAPEKRKETLELAEAAAKQEGKERPTATHIKQAAAVVRITSPKGLTPQTQDALLKAATYRQLQGDVQRIRKALRDLAQTPAGSFLPLQQINTDLRNAWEALKFATPCHPCVYCEQGYVDGVVPPDGCKACRDAGWLSRGLYDMAPEDLKK